MAGPISYMEANFMTAPQTTRGAANVGSGYTDNRPRTRSTFTEAKEGFKTSEFYVMVIFVAGVLLATYADKDTLDHADGFRYAAFAVAAYIISRGLAKLGVREPYTTDDDR
jgi:hypothetical protein